MRFLGLVILSLILSCSCSNLQNFGKVKRKNIQIAEEKSVASFGDEFIYKNFRFGNDYIDKKKAGNIWFVTDDEYVLNYVDSKPGCFKEEDVDDREIITVMEKDFETAKLIFLGQTATIAANGINLSLVNREVEYIWCTIGPPIMTHNFYYSFREARRSNAKVD